MAREPSPEESGRKILEIYKHFKAKKGHVLRSNNFVAVAATYGWDTSDLQKGLNFALEHHWVEKTSTGWLALTADGFERM